MYKEIIGLSDHIVPNDVHSHFFNCTQNIIINSTPDLIHVWNFDERNADNNTPIQICCTKGSLNVIKHLQNLKKLNFKENKEGDSCVLLAAENGHLETVKWLLQNGIMIIAIVF